ncbi:7969_t:CDS:2 [Scutellospora calospora]|uniref:7969_t:CDS:1 n=1 Tax=Scutellospora calospora TaxID=85575 RepID=A0ACA9L8D6_9GLOM|nr:7969_t:CDS:2 [Scutellospora calospora]
MTTENKKIPKRKYDDNEKSYESDDTLSGSETIIRKKILNDLQKERIQYETNRDNADREQREKESLRKVEENNRQLEQREKESLRQVKQHEENLQQREMESKRFYNSISEFFVLSSFIIPFICCV